MIAEMIATKLPPPIAKPEDCTHEEFAAAVAVAQLEDSGIKVAEVRVVCVQCRVPMRFEATNVQAGWHPERATCTIDGLELMCPIEPAIAPKLKAGASYTMPAIPKAH